MTKALGDFDFFMGRWRVRHRRLKERLAGCGEWVEFDGTCEARKILGGLGNTDDNILDMPEESYRAASLRTFDSGSGLWTIWWFDSRTPRWEQAFSANGGKAWETNWIMDFTRAS